MAPVTSEIIEVLDSRVEAGVPSAAIDVVLVTISFSHEIQNYKQPHTLNCTIISERRECEQTAAKHDFLVSQLSIDITGVIIANLRIRVINMTMRRYLSDIEVRFRNGGPHYTIRYKGKLHGDMLQRALDLLCNRHPVLRARVSVDQQGYLLYVPEKSRPQIVNRSGHGRYDLSESEIPSWDQVECLIHVIHYRGEFGGLLAFGVNHSIADARHSLALFREYWSLYTRSIVESEAENSQSSTFPSYPEKILGNRWTTINIAKSYSGIVQFNGTTNSSWISIDKTATAKIIEFAREYKISVHSLLCSAILSALRQEDHQPQPRLMECLSIIDLRDRISPTVGETEVTNFLGFHRAKLELPSSQQLTDIAYEIRQQMNRAINSRTLSLDLRDAGFSNRANTVGCRANAALVNNIGNIPPFESPKEIFIEDFISPVPEFTQTRFPNYVVYTYAGNLTLQSSYARDFFDEHDARRIDRRIAEILNSID